MGMVGRKFSLSFKGPVCKIYNISITFRVMLLVFHRYYGIFDIFTEYNATPVLHTGPLSQTKLMHFAHSAAVTSNET